MNQEIQQNVTENKKPQMYVSWLVIIVDLFIIVGWYGFAVSGASSLFEVSGDAGLFLAALFWIFTIGTGLLLAGSFLKKPRWYIRPFFVNSMFVGLSLIILVAEILYGSLKNFDLFAIRVFGWMFIGVLFSIFINHKFQKSESELGKTQSQI